MALHHTTVLQQSRLRVRVRVCVCEGCVSVTRTDLSTQQLTKVNGSAPHNSVTTVKASVSQQLAVSLCTADTDKGKGFPYSLPSVGPGADPGVQAVSPQDRHVDQQTMNNQSAVSVRALHAVWSGGRARRD